MRHAGFAAGDHRIAPRAAQHAGAGAERIASFVCDELVAEPARRIPDPNGTSDPRALRLAGVVRLHPSDVGEVLAVRPEGEGVVLAESITMVRDLVNAPPNDLTPVALARPVA